MAQMEQHKARGYLNDCGIYRDAQGFWPDFHALNSEKVDCILEVAAEQGYRKPAAANGSRARYFYSYLTRTAND